MKGHCGYTLNYLKNKFFWSGFYQFLMIIPELDSEILSQTTTVIKIVQLTCGTCLHTNKVKVSNVQRSQSHNKFPQVKTSMEQISPNSIKHLTQITYLHRKYTIEDIYEFTLVQSTQNEPRRQPGTFISESQNSKNSGQEQNSDSSKKSKQSKKQKTKKICFFHKGEKQNQRHIKRNTKNIPKNFCKAFANYMADRPNKLTEDWSIAMKNLKKIQKKQKYNNITIKKILQNQTIVPFFKDFLINYAQEWINTSKISDKKVHLQAINIYLELLGKLAYAEIDPSPPPSDQ